MEGLGLKKVWIGLSIVCVLVGIFGTVEDVMSGTPFEEAAVILFVFVLFAALFAWLAWLWRIRSPLKRTAEQIGAVADKAKENNAAYKKLSKSLKHRAWKHRIIGAIIAVAGIALWPTGNWSTLWIVIGTLMLIAGIAIFMMGSPADYNSITDGCKMIGFDRKREIEEFYEAFKEMQTPLGSAWLGRFYSSPYDSLIFGPDERGQFIYFYLNGAGEVGYIGYSFLKSFIKKRLTEPIYPPNENLGEDTAGHLCYHTDIFFFQDWLKESIEQYARTGQPLPYEASSPSDVYTFNYFNITDAQMAGDHSKGTSANSNGGYIDISLALQTANGTRYSYQNAFGGNAYGTDFDAVNATAPETVAASEPETYTESDADYEWWSLLDDSWTYDDWEYDEGYYFIWDDETEFIYVYDPDWDLFGAMEEDGDVIYWYDKESGEWIVE